MAITNYERVGKALDLLREGLRPFVERELQAQYGKYWITTRPATGATISRGTATSRTWTRPRCCGSCGTSGTSCSRRRWASASAALSASCARCATAGRTRTPSRATTPTARSTPAARLLTAISASQADEINRMKTELLRLQFDEQVRAEKRKSAGTAIESTVTGGLKPWREVVTPHRDVASGRYQQAEFAADLWQVHLGEGTDEYRDPVEFYRRTYLTESLKQMLVGALRRLSGKGARAATRSCSCRQTSAAARRTRCWRCTTCSRASRPRS